MNIDEHKQWRNSLTRHSYGFSLKQKHDVLAKGSIRVEKGLSAERVARRLVVLYEEELRRANRLEWKLVRGPVLSVEVENSNLFMVYRTGLLVQSSGNMIDWRLAKYVETKNTFCGCCCGQLVFYLVIARLLDPTDTSGAWVFMSFLMAYLISWGISEGFNSSLAKAADISDEPLRVLLSEALDRVDTEMGSDGNANPGESNRNSGSGPLTW